MASDSDDFEPNIENLKSTVRKSFAKVYASLKARELKTLRQLDAIRKQCENDKDLKRNCVQNICVNYDNESILLDHVSNFGAIDVEKLNFDSNIFTLEDYVEPENDHMYSYKTIEELTKDAPDEDLKAIEEAAIKQILSNDDCDCNVNIRSEDVSKKFRDLDQGTSPVKECQSVSSHSSFDNKEVDCPEIMQDEKSESDDLKKIDPTDDWLNTIKNQTETEPSQVTDVMEHSTIACS